MFTAKVAAVLAALSLVAAACAGDAGVVATTAAAPAATTAPTPTPGAFPVMIAATNGDIEVASLPTRIVSLSATHTEMLYAIGAGDQVVAVDEYSNFPDGTPLTEMTGFSPNVEAIVELDADLVVLDGDWDGSSVGALTELGVPVLVLSAALSFDDVYTQIEQLGVATGHVAEAAALVAQMQTDIADILASIPAFEAPPTFYHELDSVFYSVTTDTFIGQVYAAMGLQNIADAVGEGSFGYPQLSEEYILEEDPDLIFLGDTICCQMDVDTVAARPGWDTLTAVQNGAVVELSDDIASRWGPRVVDYMRSVADALAALAVGA